MLEGELGLDVQVEYLTGCGVTEGIYTQMQTGVALVGGRTSAELLSGWLAPLDLEF